MHQYLCVTCGIRFPATEQPPSHCPICEDDRQYVGHSGQQWTTLDDLRQTHTNTFTDLVEGITSITTEPRFAIGQQAHLVQTAQGNVLWDCIALIDDETIDRVTALGGIQAIALSHPHYYTTILEWSAAFDDAPVYIHADDRQWVMEPGAAIEFWDGETLEILPGSGLTMIRCGGHFDGAAVLHWRAALDGDGALFCGDTIQVVADQRWVSFMYSYPNIVPLNAGQVQRIVDAVDPFPFRRIYGAFGGVVAEDGNGAVRRSAERYIRAIRPSS
jgi:glyoxylase-like metal-dependent hydrolase (beta-lactamase superfamily II)